MVVPQSYFPVFPFLVGLVAVAAVIFGDGGVGRFIGGRGIQEAGVMIVGSVAYICSGS